MIEIILLQLFVLILFAKIAAIVFEFVRLPPLVGEIVAGIIIGNTFIFDLLQLGTNIEVLSVLAEIGVIFLLFAIGLETPFSDLKRVGGTAILVAILGVIFPFIFGFLLIVSSGFPQIEALFIGAAMTATSIGITARVIKDMNIMNSIESKVIIGAAVIDDVLGLVILAMISGIASGGAMDIVDTVMVAALAVLFVVAVVFVGSGLLPKVRKQVHEFRTPTPVMRARRKISPLAVAIIVCFGLSAAASYFGLAAIVGAFLAGMVFAEFKDLFPIGEQFEAINEFLVPFFFLYIGISVNLSTFGGVAILALMITFVAIATKFIGCGLGAYRLGVKSAAIVGVGMAPRGEVGLIIASVGLTIGSISNDMFSIVVFMSLLTTLAAPLLLTYTFNWKMGRTARF
ncbi:MAG: cation:proton antiporter [Methanomassiliicoccales archaeon]|nr:cation:proton antiporter [Methanomassiliicoccales archaeon]